MANAKTRAWSCRRDRHGTLRRRVFSRYRGLSQAELECLDTVEYSTTKAGGGGAAAASGDLDYSRDVIASHAEGGGSEVERLREESDVFCSSGPRRVHVGGAEERGGGAEAGGEDAEDDAACSGGAGVEEPSCSDCAICLGGFEEGDVLRKLPW